MVRCSHDSPNPPFARWSQRIASAHGYTVAFVPIGPDDPEVGPPTQMAVFIR
jgi:hypothetical protein